MAKQKYDARTVLVSLGVDPVDARRLLMSSRRLHTWHELECGTDRGAIQRDETTGKLEWYNNDTHKWGPYRGRDWETLALKTIKDTMAKYPNLSYYIQGDPRGCALYILRPGDVPEGENPDAYYSRGIAVYKE